MHATPDATPPRRRPSSRLSRRPCKSCNGRTVCGSVRLERETDLQRDLPVIDLAINQVSADLVDLEPAQVAYRLAGARQRVVDCAVERIGGRAGDFDRLVRVIHGGLPATCAASAMQVAYLPRCDEDCAVQRRAA